MNSHLNVFNPYRNKANHHEDELTRAFLIVLKNIPMAQSAFIEMIREEMIEMGCDLVLPAFSDVEAKISSIETQITHHNKLFEELNGRRLVSIIISDEKLRDKKDVTSSVREARYDGVILYDPSWLLIIENKPDVRNVWLDQLDPNVSDEIEIEEKPVSLRWRSIITRLSSLVEKEYIHGLEKLLLEDFLEFVEAEFPRLNPYTKLSICKNNKYLLTKRCIAIMEQIGLGEVLYHNGWKHYIELNLDGVKQVALSPEFKGEDWSIWLQFHPGDTMRQAKNLFKQIKKEAFLQLIDQGWEIYPNLHFSYRASNLVWTTVNMPIDQYIDYWVGQVDTLKQIGRAEFDATFKEYERIGLISSPDWVNLQDKILSKKYPTLNVCPGISIYYKWSSKEASERDDRNQLVEIVRTKIKEALATWEASYQT